MGNMRFKAGDRVRIKSIDWYNENKNEDGTIIFSTESGDYSFTKEDARFCGRVVTIAYEGKGHYVIAEDDRGYFWIDEMIEGLVEEEGKETSWKPSKEEMDVLYGLAYITNKYDEHKEEVITRLYQDLKREFFNGSSYENMFPNTENDVRRRSTIQVLEYARSLDNYNQYGKADIDKNIAWLEKQSKSALEARTDNELVEEEMKSEDGLLDEYEELTDRAFKGGYEKCKSDIELNGFQLPEGYRFVDENGNVINAQKIVLEKQKKEYPKTFDKCCQVLQTAFVCDVRLHKAKYYDIFRALAKLIVCRDAYWKIAGEEMGLGKPWSPNGADYVTGRHCIFVHQGNIICSTPAEDCPLTFPTEEMRDAFKENFDPDIEICKEFL